MTLTEKEAPPARSPLVEPGPAPDDNNPTRVIQLLVALALITAVFLALGWGYLLLFIAILFAIVMLHEFGHFITAKRAGMKVTEYFVGFGPRLWSVRRGETEYGVKAIPAGGYVRIVGFTSTEEVAEEDEPRAYRQQPFHQRIIVASAGSAMHLLIALVLALVLVFTFGKATNNYNVAALEHWPGRTTPAALAGLRVGDTIVSINGKNFTNPNSMTDAIKDSAGTPLRLGVERDGKLIHLTATPENGKGITVDGTKLANRGLPGRRHRDGDRVRSARSTRPAPPCRPCGSSPTQEARGIGSLFSPSGLSGLWHQLSSPKYAQSVANNPNLSPRASSIVGIANIGAQAEQAGLASLLLLLIAINIVFAILNMLPMIPLDGGHVAVAAYEWVRTKRGQAVLPGRHHQAVPRGRGLHRHPGPHLAVRLLPRHHAPAAPHALTAVDLSSSLLSPRRPTRRITLGGVPIGDGAPVTVQSMTTTKTADVDGTLAQIYALAAAGADIVRCTCNEEAAAEGLAHIVPRSPVPIVADIHFHHEMALAALEAGVQGLRLNPGNLRKEAEIKQVAAEARDRGVPIRIGVNAGSLHPDLYKKYGGATPEALVESARNELAFFEEVDFTDVKISVKASSVALMIAAYRLASETFDHPLHLGVTEAGPPPAGLVKGTAGIGALLAEGIGDTIRFSLTADPVEEARAGRQLLESLGLRERKGLDLIACPSCGRAQVDVIAVAKEAQEALEKLHLPIQVAVMGCVVNGPGEAREADIGIAAGKQKGHLFIRGKIIRVVPEADMVQALVDEAERLVAEGVEARIAAADESAEAEAEADRRALLDSTGADPNHTSEKIEIIRRHSEDDTDH